MLAQGVAASGFLLPQVDRSLVQVLRILFIRAYPLRVGIRQNTRIVDAAATAAAIGPLPAVRIAGGDTRLVRAELALKRGKDARRIGAGSEKARGVRPDPSVGIGPQPAGALGGFE
ncbi:MULTISPECIES: hypothetical protein [unclassified Nitrobacter]|uniref:hypothetical protein n=1 Tax=unclassified Nitrobacter TaxID=2620411 RepID=UPI00092C782E|nr:MULTISPECIES: hypothetical protein [unclassified Nitrobacter]MBN9147609.1 hypothetical protein [Nitrobacter sp.]OJV02976.1 MAG: hypothetical protein BGO16_03365 [Nitrobacter sp. 62-23]